jgi:hypothetical protein
MSTSENEKARAEARAEVSSRPSPGRFEGGLARALATLAYAASHPRAERRSDEARR